MDSHGNFSHLSIRDLIEARDRFHVHLMNKKNVVAPAIGRYLIRKIDLDDFGRMKPRQERMSSHKDQNIIT